MLVFLIGCIGTRLALSFLAKVCPPHILKIMSVVAALISVGFMTIYMLGLRKTGVEVGGKDIWWDDLRPVHSILFGTFAVLAWVSPGHAWKVLLGDTLLGLTAWLVHYYY